MIVSPVSLYSLRLGVEAWTSSLKRARNTAGPRSGIRKCAGITFGASMIRRPLVSMALILVTIYLTLKVIVTPSTWYQLQAILLMAVKLLHLSK